MTLTLIGLTLAASLSPLLTFAYLFQLKEWRWDRLREHFRTEGYARQLFGITRPAIFCFFGGLGFFELLPSWPLAFLLTITLFNTTQILTSRQPYPVWTKKAVTLTGTGLLLTTVISYWLLVTHYWFLLVLVPLSQPVSLFCSWVAWKPIDYILKQRILAKAKTFRAQFPSLTVIGITGSTGKTTTKELLAHILAPETIATPEHVNTELGVAKWLICTLGTRNQDLGPRTQNQDLPQSPVPSPQILIVEMGAYHEGEIRTLCSVAKPTMGIITNIGTQHIGLFGSQRAIAEAKGELFAALPKNGHAFVNIDTPFAQELRKKCCCPVTTVSAANAADLQATNVEEASEGLRFHIRNILFTIPMHGEHQLGNVLLAVATATELGMTLENIAKKLQTFQPPAHTFSLGEEHGITTLDDTHNASPESLSAAIEWARHQPYKKKILLTPGIIEQGSAAARMHVRCGALAKDVFDEAYILNKKFAQYFEQGFGKPVEQRVTSNRQLPVGSLLVCVGRVPQATIQKFLP